jgi:hypothetical protein
MLDVSTRRWTTTAFCILIAGSGCNNDHRKTATGDAGPAPDVGARDENVLTPDGRAPDSSAELRADNVRSQDADAGVTADTKPDFTVDVQPVDLRLQDDPGRMGMPSGPPPLSSSIGGECGVWDYSLVCASQ